MRPAALTSNVTAAPHPLSDVRRTAGSFGPVALRRGPQLTSGVHVLDRPGRGEAPSLVSRYKLVFTQYLSAEALVIFRRTASTSDRPPVSFKATSPKLANSGRVVNEPDDAIIATAIVAARANRKRIDDPIPWDQFDTNDFQHR
jgi:hypothetical protein